jgi:hypothetical protein
MLDCYRYGAGHMIPKAIHAMSFDDIAILVGQAAESRTLEFKSEMPDDAKLIQGISAFANATGGDFVIGVTASADGVAASVVGVVMANVDAEKLRIEQILRSGLEPRLPRIDFQPIPCPQAGRHVLVIRTARSWVGPHRVVKDNKFYGRNSAGKYPLDIGELRSAFLLGERAAERIRAFQADRLAKILGGATPVPLGPGAVVLHVVPSPAPFSFSGRDFAVALQSGTHFPLPLQGPGGGNSYRYNLDGVVNAAPVREGVYRYAQMFRSGAIEGALPMSLRDDGQPYVHGKIMGRKIVTGARQFVGAYTTRNAPIRKFVTKLWQERLLANFNNTAKLNT